MFHMGWFLGNGFGIQPWNGLSEGTWIGGAASTNWNGSNGIDWMKPDLYTDLTDSLERASFDYILIEDTSMIEDTFGASMETTLKYGIMAPKNDPMPLVPLMTQRTKHIGVIPTVSTVAYPPFLAARLLTTLDHLTNGRIGANVVTSVTDRVAQNFGLREHIEHDLRYEMAGEWMDVLTQLWESWEPGAVLLDEPGNVYADHTKVHPIDFEGRYFRSRGPLNTIPGPQRRPVIAQAGNSIPGRELAARNADTMLAHASSVAEMKAFRIDMRERVIAHGRKPDDLKVLFLVTPVIGETDAQAQEADRVRQLGAWSPAAIDNVLWTLSYVSGGKVDFAQFDLDKPMPEVVGNGEQSSMASFVKAANGRTLREVAATHFHVPNLDLIGSPDTVAVKMGEIMEEVGGDGFLLFPSMTRRSISEIADGLAPALKRRGLMRTGYGHENFRDNLLEF